jgi:hypothetical protein
MYCRYCRYVLPPKKGYDLTDSIGCVLQTAAVNVGMLIAGRLIAGIAIGELSMIVPMYQACLSPFK